MTSPANKTMLNYFTKLPSKACVVEEANPRKLAPIHNKQHVEKFQKDKLEQFDALLYTLNNSLTCPETESPSGTEYVQATTEPALKSITNVVPLNYIASIKSGLYRPFRVSRKPRGPLRAKLLQYSEDVRPAYFGTWQKKSDRITGRRPFGKDEVVFDYEVDSEAEWDLGGPGESLKGDDSEDEEELDDYEIDMKTFVPHGYVSDDEVEVHSDPEDNGSSSANQSVGEEEEEVICDVEEDSNSSVQIVGEKRIKLTTISNVNKQASKTNGNNGGSKKTIQSTKANSPQQQTAIPVMKQPKVDIKPIILGIHYENQPESAIISESKLHFLKSFQGFLCN